MITVTQLKKQIFSSGNIDTDWDNDELGTIYQIQAEAEHILSEALTSGDINHSQSQQLMQQLMNEYGYQYPVKVENYN